MRNVRTDAGEELLAEFTVEPTAAGADVIIESRGGSDGGPTPARHHDYNPGLELLLRRLGAQGAVLTAASVDSRVTRKLPPGAGDLMGVTLPLTLSTVTDVEALRFELGRAIAAVGRKKPTGGNPTKRLRLGLAWAAAVGRTGADLEALLAGPAPAKSPTGPRPPRLEALGDFLRRQGGDVRLTFSEIETLVGAPLPGDAVTPQFWANTWLHHWSRRRQWLEAGYRTRPDLAGRAIRFVRALDDAITFTVVELRGVAIAGRRLLDGADTPVRIRGETMSGALEDRTATAYAERLRNLSAILQDLDLAVIPGFPPLRGDAAEKPALVELVEELWPADGQSEDASADPDVVDTRASAARSRRRQRGGAPPPPPAAGGPGGGRVTATVTRFSRNPRVVDWVLEAAAGHCEVCGDPAPFLRSDGEPFLEIHHVRHLAEGGPDQVDNAVAGCPNCHRRLHHAPDREALRQEVITRISRLTDHPRRTVLPLMVATEDQDGS